MGEIIQFSIRLGVVVTPILLAMAIILEESWVIMIFCIHLRDIITIRKNTHVIGQIRRIKAKMKDLTLMFSVQVEIRIIWNFGSPHLIFTNIEYS